MCSLSLVSISEFHLKLLTVEGLSEVIYESQISWFEIRIWIRFAFGGAHPCCFGSPIFFDGVREVVTRYDSLEA
jgi:hypothetical protein